MTTIDNYKLVKTLGQGAFAQVKLAKDGDGKKVALKITSYLDCTDEQREDDSYYAEIDCLQQIDHKNICKMINFNEHAKAVTTEDKEVDVSYLAVEYAKEGELFDWVTKTGKFTEEESRYFFHQLIDALEYLHSNGYYHRDIKPENLVLTKNFDLQLIDFGFATKDPISSKRRGTIQYMSPEVLKNKTYRWEQADLFGAIVTLFNLVTQHTPFFKAEAKDSYYQHVINEDWEEYWKSQSGDDLSKEFKDLFERWIDPEPSNRLTLSEIKAHEWYKGKVLSEDDMHMRMVARKKFRAFHSSKKLPEEKEQKLKKQHKKITKFYEMEDGDELVDTIIEFSRNRGYQYTKSPEYFQVEIAMNLPGYAAKIMANVLKKTKKNQRWIQLVLVKGDKTQFGYVFDQLERYCDTKWSE